MIEIQRTGDGDPLEFEVVIREGGSETRHQVAMRRHTCERLGGGEISPEQVIDAAFRFLLDRETKEAILGRFDLSLISRYFPAFERELPRYLADAG